jgi:polyhydroxyalkanoate synthesis regulator phasin
MMNPKEVLLKEMLEKVGDKISEQTISEKINQFLKSSNMFLLFEVMSLKKEIERIKEDVKSIKNP